MSGTGTLITTALAALRNGLGHPQSASLAGLSADYMTQQLADFKSGARHASVGNSIMAIIARALTAEEARAAITYYSRLPRTPWITVIEGAMVPKTRIIEGGLRVPLEPLELEPLGQRIVEVPKFPARSRLYDSHAPFVAYVPTGSIKRGGAFVSNGGAVMRGTTVVVPAKRPPVRRVTARACEACRMRPTPTSRFPRSPGDRQPTSCGSCTTSRAARARGRRPS